MTTLLTSTELLTDYDRLYDMPVDLDPARVFTTRANSFAGNTMREGGLEPPSLTAPDPKSRQCLLNAAAPSKGHIRKLRPKVRHGAVDRRR